MQNKSDTELLRSYAKHGDQDAFREIVGRYERLVFSAALRQIDSPDLARDIAQSVFLDLARKSGEVGAKLSTDTPLVGWLYRSTRFAVLRHLRDDRRRADKEKEAMQQFLANSEPGPDWDAVRPLLDDAMLELADADRSALLLRYFQNQDLRTVGTALGISEDAAQKRVSRAMERLRELFVKRGVKIGVGGLIAAISANAVQAAPVNLFASMAAAGALSATQGGTSVLFASAKPIVMTTAHKILAVALCLTAATAVYENRQAAHAQQNVQTLQEQQAAQAQQIAQLHQLNSEQSNRVAALQLEAERASTDTAQLAKLRAENARLRGGGAQAQSTTLNPNDPFTESLLALSQRAAELNAQFEKMPDKRIPELAFLRQNDWIDVAGEADLSSEEGIRKALSKLRQLAKNRFSGPACAALDGYIHDHDGALPTTLQQLSPYFKEPVTNEVLDRYKIVRTGKVEDVPKDSWAIITEKAPVDRQFDTCLVMGSGHSGTYGVGDHEAPPPDWVPQQ